MPQSLGAVSGLRSAFSLIEVVVAMGIISFCLVGMLGLLTVAASSGRDSVDHTEGSLLFEKVFNQLKLKPFDKQQLVDSADRSVFPLPRLDTSGKSKPFFVDGQSLLVDDGTGGSGEAERAVRVVVLDAPNLEIEKMQAPLEVTAGKLAFVRVEIWSPAGAYHPELVDDPGSTGTKPNPAGLTVFYTEISPFDQ